MIRNVIKLLNQLHQIGQSGHQRRRLHRADVSALEKLARDIAIIEPDPQDWTGWVNYLLESLQTEAQKDRKSATYEAMLLDLREALETRIEGGKW